NGHPGQFQGPIAWNGHFSTGQLSGFLGVFFKKFLFWALYVIPEVIHGIKPACLELSGLSKREGGWGKLCRGGFVGIGGLFWIPALPLSPVNRNLSKRLNGRKK
ncbi:MAG: hypothetical protein Q8N94_10730, partial [Methanoregula sp.]|nr:hypothetical protein [Methanoregula sp.]